MCGINGIISLKKVNLRDKITIMNDTIIHRGPDADGIYLNDNVTMGMRRLSIIDLASGNQPMFSEDKNIIIVFNGEIYNFKNIKKKLETEFNIMFKTHSDTEVILKGYEVWGKDVLQYLNGMFAFSIYDKKRGKVFIARDRAGEKPLYYFKNENYFIWGSELKSLIAVLKNDNESLKISSDAINLYFSLSFIPAPYTIYEKVFKLCSGNYLEIDVNTLEFDIIRYWDVEIEENKNKITNYTVAQKELRDTLYDSVEKRMIADVPLGVFLSGGIDSSIITAIMSDIKKGQSIQTFSIGVEDKNYDESHRASMVAKHLKTEHNAIDLNFNEVRESIDDVIKNYDEPFADSSALPTYYVSKIARQKVKVALTGDGGDEVFGGYERYMMGYYGRKYRMFIPNIIHQNILKPIIGSINQSKENRYSALSKIKKLVDSLGENELEDIFNVMSLCFNEKAKESLLKEPYRQNKLINLLSENIAKIAFNQSLSYLTKSRYIDKNIALDGDMLVKVDRASMLASLESRAPLLDHRLFEFTNRLPDSFLINGTDKKFILKDTFKILLPPNFLNLPKRGFAIPIGTWLRENLRTELLELTDKDFLKKQGIFNEDYLSDIVREHINYIQDHSYKVWSIYCFQKWYKNQVQ